MLVQTLWYWYSYVEITKNEKKILTHVTSTIKKKKNKQTNRNEIKRETNQIELEYIAR